MLKKSDRTLKSTKYWNWITNNRVIKYAKDLNRHFSKWDIQMVSKLMKRCSASLAIRKMLMKTTMKYYFMLTRMTIIRKNNNKCWPGCEEIGALIHCWWKYEMLYLLWKMVRRFLKKLNIKLSYDPGIPLLGTPHSTPSSPKRTGNMFT